MDAAVIIRTRSQWCDYTNARDCFSTSQFCVSAQKELECQQDPNRTVCPDVPGNRDSQNRSDWDSSARQPAELVMEAPSLMQIKLSGFIFRILAVKKIQGTLFHFIWRWNASIQTIQASLYFSIGSGSGPMMSGVQKPPLGPVSTPMYPIGQIVMQLPLCRYL